MTDKVKLPALGKPFPALTNCGADFSGKELDSGKRHSFVFCFHRFVCVGVCEAGIGPACEGIRPQPCPMLFDV